MSRSIFLAWKYGSSHNVLTWLNPLPKRKIRYKILKAKSGLVPGCEASKNAFVVYSNVFEEAPEVIKYFVGLDVGTYYSAVIEEVAEC